MKIKLCAFAIFFVLFGCVACESIPTDDEVVSMIDELDKEQSLNVLEGLTLEKVPNADETAARSETLADRIVRYLKSHEVKFEISEARSSVGGKLSPVKKIKSTLSI